MSSQRFTEVVTCRSNQHFCELLRAASMVYWSEFLAVDPDVRIRFPAVPDFLSSGSGTGSTQPREYN
jgi:hypothetical protein